MMKTDVVKTRKKMEKVLDDRRYEHTLGVAYTAAALAMRYGQDPANAYMAGLLHDCAKCISNDKKIQICERHNLPITETERINPFLLHAKVGSYIAMHKYGVTDPDIINAILNHTTGRPNMTFLEKIIYIADYIEPGRKQAPHLTIIRELAFKDYDKALLMILEDTLSYLKTTGAVLDPMTQKTFDFYNQKV